MKTHLMYKDADFDVGMEVTYRGIDVAGRALPSNAEDLIQDLELTTLFRAMALGDPFLNEVARYAVLSGLDDPAAIDYRQRVLDDCIAQPLVIRELYALAIEAITSERKIYRPTILHPSGILRRSIEAMRLLTEVLHRLRRMAETHADKFQSEGFATFFAMLKENLDDDYFATIEAHLKHFNFKEGTLISAELGRGNKGVRYVLHAPTNFRQSWKERVGIGPHSSYSFNIHPRDEAGARAIEELTDRGLNLVANALAQSCEHILSFLSMLATELGFYVGCLNLHDLLTEKGEPVCMPVPMTWSPPSLSFDNLYDVCLTLNSKSRVVGNAANADQKMLVMITGANSGGKSTLLRSIGLAQLMMSCGMFVGAKSFRANVDNGIFTHFTREEDATMTSGKLDEELSRMSDTVDHLTARSLMLFNESFAATNEREGSEVAYQIVRALLERDVKVLFVTHQFTLADRLYHERSDSGLFLRAQREIDGRRSFKIGEGEPLSTSFGEDLYERVGGFRQIPAEKDGSSAILGADSSETSDLGDAQSAIR